MAFDATTLLEAREYLSTPAAVGMGKQELRMPIFGALKAHMDSSPLLMPGFDANAVKKSTQQPVTVQVFKKQPLGTGRTRKCAGSGTGATAAKPITFLTIVEEFAVSELEMQNNNLSEQDLFNRLLVRAMVSAYTRLEKESVAHLEAIKSPLNNGGYFPTTTGNAKQVNYVDRLNLWAGVESEMMENDFSGMVNFVGDTVTKAISTYVGAQGAGNGVNLAYQEAAFNGYYSRFVQRGAAAYATEYFFEPGTIGFYPWTRPDFLSNKDIGTDIWTTFTDPVMGMRWELKVKKGCVDAGIFGLDGVTPVAGTEAGYVESYVLSTSYSFTEAYSSDASTGVFKYEILKSV
jgi:hypothetical protein